MSVKLQRKTSTSGRPLSIGGGCLLCVGCDIRHPCPSRIDGVLLDQKARGESTDKVYRWYVKLKGIPNKLLRFGLGSVARVHAAGQRVRKKAIPFAAGYHTVGWEVQRVQEAFGCPSYSAITAI